MEKYGISTVILFLVLPYVALALFFIVSIIRYRVDRFTYSSLSSQFLETRALFWGSVPWHYGIVGVLLGHLLGLLIPGEILVFAGEPLRLLVLEATGLALAVLALVGLAQLVVRRLFNDRLRRVTSYWDIIVLVILLIQVVTGILIAVQYKFGAIWYAGMMAPYLQSIFVFSPNLEFVYQLPIIVKIHIINAFIFVAIFPFTRLVHIVSLPFRYITRPYQVVVWNWDRKNRRTNI